MTDNENQQDSGNPGGGAGRREEVGRSGVYEVSDMDEAPGDAVIQPMASWGQGDRGAEGYYDHGVSAPSTIGDEKGVVGTDAGVGSASDTDESEGSQDQS